MAAGFRTALWLLGLAAGTTPPPTPPPEVPAAALSGGWLTPAHIARLRGWQAPPRRQPQDEEEDARGQESDVLAAADTGLVTPAPPAAELTTLLATAIPVAPVDWGPLWTLAPADVTRRQALAARGEEEELLVLLLMLEVL